MRSLVFGLFVPKPGMFIGKTGKWLPDKKLTFLEFLLKLSM